LDLKAAAEKLDLAQANAGIVFDPASGAALGTVTRAALEATLLAWNARAR
jgi:hypothetical protein